MLIYIFKVLLSCSHIFHFKCLKAFESYSGKKSCPMCRNSRYQKRVVYDATKHYKNISAIKLVLSLILIVLNA